MTLGRRTWWPLVVLVACGSPAGAPDAAAVGDAAGGDGAGPDASIARGVALVGSANGGGSESIWLLDARARPVRVEHLEDLSANVAVGWLSPDRFYVSDPTGHVVVHGLTPGAVPLQLPLSSSELFAPSPSGDWFVGVNGQGTITAYATDHIAAVEVARSSACASIAPAPTGDRVAISCASEIVLVDLAAPLGPAVTRWRSALGGGAMAWSPDGRWIMGSLATGVGVLDTARSSPMLVVGTGPGVGAWSPTGDRLAISAPSISIYSLVGEQWTPSASVVADGYSLLDWPDADHLVLGHTGTVGRDLASYDVARGSLHVLVAGAGEWRPVPGQHAIAAVAGSAGWWLFPIDGARAAYFGRDTEWSADGTWATRAEAGDATTSAAVVLMDGATGAVERRDETSCRQRLHVSPRSTQAWRLPDAVDCAGEIALLDLASGASTVVDAPSLAAVVAVAWQPGS